MVFNALNIGAEYAENTVRHGFVGIIVPSLWGGLGRGLTRICNETKALEGYKEELKPVFKSTPTQFQTIIFASSDTPNVGDNDGDMSETKLTERQQKILNLIKESPTITGKQMSETLSVSQRTIERDLSALQKLCVLKREGKDNNGAWVIIVKI